MARLSEADFLKMPLKTQQALREHLPVERKPKQNKHRVGPKSKRTVDGIVFHSEREATRYSILKLLVADGQVTELKRQVPFKLHGRRGDFIGNYIADFTYTENGKSVVEDAKGQRLPFYKWKKKMFEAEYGVKIRET